MDHLKISSNKGTDGEDLGKLQSWLFREECQFRLTNSKLEYIQQMFLYLMLTFATMGRIGGYPILPEESKSALKFKQIYEELVACVRSHNHRVDDYRLAVQSYNLGLTDDHGLAQLRADLVERRVALLNQIQLAWHLLEIERTRTSRDDEISFPTSDRIDTLARDIVAWQDADREIRVIEERLARGLRGGPVDGRNGIFIS